MAELIIHSGKLQGKRLELPQRSIIIGRDESCQMRLTSSLVSRQHCQLNVTPEGIWVKDLESQNGTYVNDVAVTEPLLLKSGDVLRVGATLFQVPEASVRTATSSPKPNKDKISDDDISDWLSDDDHEIAGKSSTDTAVIQSGKSSSKSSDSTIVQAPIASIPPNPVRTSSSAKQPPRTVKEEAADIIRRHWEMVRARQGK